MLKTNNNKRNFTILVGILVAIAIIISSFGPTKAGGISDALTSFIPKVELPDLNYQSLVKIFSPY